MDGLEQRMGTGAARDAALRRLSRVRAAIAGGAAALVAAFSVVAAQAHPGHTKPVADATTPPVAAAGTQTAPRPATGTGTSPRRRAPRRASPAKLSPPAQAPQATTAPAQTSSGGS